MERVRLDTYLWSVRLSNTRSEAAAACKNGRVLVHGVAAQLEKLNAPVETIFLKRDRGTGRPTKKERREIDRLMEEGF